MEVVELFVCFIAIVSTSFIFIIIIIIIDVDVNVNVDVDDDNDNDISKLAVTRSRLGNSSFDRKIGLGRSAPFSASSGESRLASSLNCLLMRRRQLRLLGYSAWGFESFECPCG